jgi:hypothetical protein
MKQTQKLAGWAIKRCGRICNPGCEHAVSDVEAYQGDWIEIKAPLEIQEALMKLGLLSDSVLEDGEAEYCKWVAEEGIPV